MGRLRLAARIARRRRKNFRRWLSPVVFCCLAPSSTSSDSLTPGQNRHLTAAPNRHTVEGWILTLLPLHCGRVVPVSHRHRSPQLHRVRADRRGGPDSGRPRSSTQGPFTRSARWCRFSTTARGPRTPCCAQDLQAADGPQQGGRLRGGYSASTSEGSRRF